MPEDVNPIGAQRFQEFHSSRLVGPPIDIIPGLRQRGVCRIAFGPIPAPCTGMELFAAFARYLDEKLPDDQYTSIIFDCPAAIGYQSLKLPRFAG